MLFPRHYLMDAARALRHKFTSGSGPQSAFVPLCKPPGQLNLRVGFGSAASLRLEPPLGTCGQVGAALFEHGSAYGLTLKHPTFYELFRSFVNPRTMQKHLIKRACFPLS